MRHFMWRIANLLTLGTLARMRAVEAELRTGRLADVNPRDFSEILEPPPWAWREGRRD